MSADMLTANRRQPITKINELCPRFTSTGSPFPSRLVIDCRAIRSASRSPQRRHSLTSYAGQCLKGPNCRFIHDPQRVAICKDYLSKGTCPLGDACDLSHQSTPNRVPACVHFLRGNCTNSDCRYAHVRVNPGSPVCRPFGKIGYCEKGADCAERHVFECPDYANTGVCRKANCRLPHVDRAGQIRRAAATEGSNAVDTEEPFDISSDEDDFDNSDDVDSDDLEEIFGDEDDAAGQAMSKQQDFIQF